MDYHNFPYFNGNLGGFNQWYTPLFQPCIPGPLTGGYEKIIRRPCFCWLYTTIIVGYILFIMVNMVILWFMMVNKYMVNKYLVGGFNTL